MNIERIYTLVSKPHSKKEIVRILTTLYGKNTENYRKVLNAFEDAASTHKRKKRKNGDRVIDHERSMSLIATEILGIKCPEILTAIFLHDLYEDYPNIWTLNRIQKKYGLKVRDLVSAVTKPPPKEGENVMSMEYSKRMVNRVNRGGYEAWIIKIIDRLHNMTTIYPDSNRGRNVWKVAQTIMFIQPKAVEMNVLALEMQLAIAIQINFLGIKSKEMPWSTAV